MYFENNPQIIISPTSASAIQIYARNNLMKGHVQFCLAAEQESKQACLPDKNYLGNVTVKINGKKKKYKFTSENNGILLIRSKQVNSTDAFFIEAQSNEYGQISSNIVSQSAPSEKYKIYFGDMHVHSDCSDGLGRQAEVIERARDWKQLDFIAMNEHIEDCLTWKKWNNEKWEAIQECFNNYYTPDKFVTIGGLEYRSYCNLWCFDNEYIKFTAPDIHDYTKNQKAIQAKIKKMTQKSNWLVGYHRLECLKEDLGFLPEPVHLLQLAHVKRPPEIGTEAFLERGDKVGFFGGSDSHFGVPAQSLPGKPKNAQTGLTGILAKRLTREGIHEALKKRRCYATMGSRHLVDFRLNGHFMGDIIKSHPTSRNISLSIKGLEIISRVEIVRNGKTIKTFAFDSNCIQVEYKDSEKLDKEAYYFSRTFLNDGRMIWTSPVWISFKKRGEIW
jgi:hypothetical protein